MQSAVRVLEARGVSGIIVSGSQIEEAWQGFPWSRFSVVKIMPWLEAKMGFDTVLYDNFGMMLDVGRRISKQRPKSAQIFLSRNLDEPLTDLQTRAAAMLVTQQWKEEGIPCKSPIISTYSPYRVLQKFFSKKTAETVIVMNPSVEDILADNGLSSPKDIQIITLDRMGHCSFSGYERQLDLIAHNAIQRLDSLVRQGEKGVPKYQKIISVPNRWVNGKSFTG